MTITMPKTKVERDQLLRDAEALRSADGTFKDDAAREAFDAHMVAIETFDRQPPAAPVPAVDADAIRAEERGRITTITHAVRVAGLEADFATGLIGRGVTLDQARAAIFDEMAKRQAKQPPTDNKIRIENGADARDKFLRGAVNWLLVKGGAAETVARAEKADVATIDPGEFRGLTLLDLAKECLVRAGVTVRGLDKTRIIAQAFTRRDITQSTSDFATLLENTMHKVLQASYAMTPDTWSKWCARGTVSDFRAHNRYRMGSFGALDALAENGEFKSKGISDGEKGSITATTKGNIINVSRQMIVNDDMGAFSRLLTMLGRAAALSVEVDAYALLGLNSGLGPSQTDGQPLFHSNRANVGTQGAISAATIDADRVVMASQTAPGGLDYTDLRPAVLLVPVALGGVARIINLSQYDPDTLANKSQTKPNVVAGLFREVVDTPRLSGNRRYLFADPSIAPVFEVAFLEGQTSPYIETKDGWNSDGAEMKVRFDYGVAATDWRGAVTNAG